MAHRLLVAIVLAVCAEQVAAIFLAPEDLDVDSAIKSEKVFRDTMRCVFGDDDYKYCDSHSVTIKYTIWNLVQEGCNSCTDEDLKVFRFMAYISNNKPKEWQQVLDVFDPQGEFKKKNGAQWKQYGIVV
ncbi:putative odorant-binding protein A10 [Schistocerca cancellata]|uniref:putative odorant-binding protein A10 n=1 Tax=Schistocerca cancellata TaxID=274614 RepID=UPI0021175652|nr:putative odorant-binding protein A10 [Schistocerca cancellata]